MANADEASLSVDAVANGTSAVLQLTGELDAGNVDSFVTESERVVADGYRHVILDCTSLTFCDSQGLRAMTELWQAVQPDGSVTLDQPSDQLIKMLQITRLHDILEVVRRPG